MNEVVVKICISKGRMRRVINIPFHKGKTFFVSSELQLKRRKSKIVEDSIVAEKGSPKLNPSLISIDLRKEAAIDQRAPSPDWLSQFQIFLFFFVQERQGWEEFSSHRYVEGHSCGDRAWNLKEDETKERKYLG
jgi:hypothetical protein